MPGLLRGHEIANPVRCADRIEELWDCSLERHPHSTERLWTTRGTQRVHHWFFEGELFQLSPKLCLDTMKATCKSYLNQFANEKHEPMLYSIGISYRVAQDEAWSHSKVMYDTWTLQQFDANYSDVTSFLITDFYDKARIASEPGPVRIRQFSLHCKTLSDQLSCIVAP